VLWIGWLQWQIRTGGSQSVAEPVVHDYGNIECRDAVLAYDRQELATDADGRTVTRWDGKTTKVHPVTGEKVPDEAAQVPEWRYVNPRQAEWPQAEFIVGNPPFIGKLKMRERSATVMSLLCGKHTNSFRTVQIWSCTGGTNLPRLPPRVLVQNLASSRPTV